MSLTDMLVIGQIEAIFRYPVKSMRGASLEDATLGWHGIEGDRRLALRRTGDRGGFPWLTASTLPELVLFTPLHREDADRLPSHVRTPEGDELPVFGEELAADIGRRHRTAVEMMHLDRGVFDETPVSVITSGTVREVCRLGGRDAEVRRFRPNVLIRTAGGVPFEEDEWVGGVLTFGDAADAPRVTVTMRDIRCAMVNLDPDDGSTDPEMLKAVVRFRENRAGVYGTVTRTGRLAVGQRVVLHR